MLLVSDEPADAEELKTRLGVAKSSLSVALRQLEQYGLLTRSRRPKASRDSYRLVDNMFEASFRSKLAELTVFGGLAARGAELLPESSDARARLIRLSALYAFMEEEIAAVFERWDARQRDEQGS
ncbi:MAG: MarR family transcriptional regulator [Salinibacterium sp.]|nr:MarR family transcriptional regulator [Salinibacterium sp.]